MYHIIIAVSMSVCGERASEREREIERKTVLFAFDHEMMSLRGVGDEHNHML